MRDHPAFQILIKVTKEFGTIVRLHRLNSKRIHNLKPYEKVFSISAAQIAVTVENANFILVSIAEIIYRLRPSKKTKELSAWKWPYSVCLGGCFSLTRWVRIYNIHLLLISVELFTFWRKLWTIHFLSDYHFIPVVLREIISQRKSATFRKKVPRYSGVDWRLSLTSYILSQFFVIDIF